MFESVTGLDLPPAFAVKGLLSLYSAPREHIGRIADDEMDNIMENMEIAIALMMVLLASLHTFFAIKACKAVVDISPGRKRLWCMLSLVFGPAGYYFYQGLIPCDMIHED
ncbi:hypothetical protein [Shewanella cyperi]|nr:hypothetical protein [Shewanella cyperi]